MRITAVSFELDHGKPEVILQDDFGEVSAQPLCERHYDGIFVADSFAKLRGPRPWYYYLAIILFEVWKSTGMMCAAVVLAGACFDQGSYFDMLKVIIANFQKPRFMVWISMGNDLYPLSWRAPGGTIEDKHLYEEVIRLLRFASKWVPEQRFVFGGSSSLWAYPETYSASLCIAYDAYCNMLTRQVQEWGPFPCITGSRLFEGVRTADRIGHVNAYSLDIVIEGFRVLTKWGMAGSTPRSRL